MHLVLGAGCAALVLLATGTVVRTPAVSAAPRLVELKPSASCDAAAILRDAGATTVAASLRLYRLEGDAAAGVLPRIRACNALRFTGVDSVAGTMSTADFTDPLVGTEWWRAAIGVDGLIPPGPGKPITIVDSGVDVAHPEFAGRAGIVTLNAQEPAPLGGVHGTAVASLIGAPANDVGTVGIYPEALLQTWDAALGAGVTLQTSDIVAGVLTAANQGPGVINLSLGSDRSLLPIQQAIETAIRKGMPPRGMTETSAARCRFRPACRTCSRRPRQISRTAPPRSRAGPASSISRRRGTTSRSPRRSTTAGRRRRERASPHRSLRARRRGCGRCGRSSTRASCSR